MSSEPFDVDRLDDAWPFEIGDQAAHLFKHPYLGLDDVASDELANQYRRDR